MNRQREGGVIGAGALLAIAVLLHGPADLAITLANPGLESNPIVLALGFQSWAILKAGLVGALIGVYFAGGHRHRFARPTLGACAATGAVAVGGNLAVLSGVVA